MYTFTSDIGPGDFVYLKTDPHQQKGIVTGITFDFHGAQYRIAFGKEDSYHFREEITTKVDQTMMLGLKDE